jgi:sugar lactone lactonase YvrE
MWNNVNPDGSGGEIEKGHGKLFRLNPDGNVTEWRANLGIANTLAWNPERTIFYFADTLLNTVYQYDYDVKTSDLANERVFFKDFPRGSPDGSTMDSEGYLWNCRYGGSCIVRVAPNGAVDRVIEMPTSNVTTCTFGGPDLRTLYITTAAAGTKPGDRFAGGLFALQTEVPGQSENRFWLRDL